MGSTVGSSKHHARLKNYISWFEVPVYDIHRAAAFYNAIYGIEMEISVNGEFAMAYFPADEGVGGALIAGPGCYPSDTGSLIYLNAGNDLEGVLRRVELAGGRVIMPKTHINDASGNFALFIDSEGNRLALHEGPARTAPATKAERPKVKAVKKAVVKKVLKKAAKKKR
jgi:uncharacterized protein